MQFTPRDLTNQAKISAANISVDKFYSLGTDLYGNRDIVVLALWNLSSTSAIAYASLTYKEII